MVSQVVDLKSVVLILSAWLTSAPSLSPSTACPIPAAEERGCGGCGENEPSEPCCAPNPDPTDKVAELTPNSDVAVFFSEDTHAGPFVRRTLSTSPKLHPFAPELPLYLRNRTLLI